jgi:hypothetical protein
LQQPDLGLFEVLNLFVVGMTAAAAMAAMPMAP